MSTPSFEALLQEAHAALQNNRPDKALALAQTILKQDKGHVEAWFVLAQAAEKRADKCTALRRLLYLAPDHPEGQKLFAAIGCSEIAGVDQMKQAKARRRNTPVSAGVAGFLIVALIFAIQTYVRDGSRAFEIPFNNMVNSINRSDDEDISLETSLFAEDVDNPFFDPRDALKGTRFRPYSPSIAGAPYRDDDARQIAGTGRPQAVIFYRDSCESCQSIREEVQLWEDTYWGDIDFIYLDVDNPDSALFVEYYRVTSLPSVALLEANGELIVLFTGRSNIVESLRSWDDLY